MQVIAYFDVKSNTVEVYPETSTRRIVQVQGVKTLNAARAALKRRGFTVDDTTGAYPYGLTLTGRG